MKSLSLISSLIAIALYLILVSAQFASSVLAGKQDWKSIGLAARMEPANAEYQYQLAQALSDAQREPEAKIALGNAVKLNPRHADYWTSLASSDYMLGFGQDEHTALQNAVAVDPKNTGVAIRAANLYWLAGDVPSALREFRIALEGDPSLAGPVIALCWSLRPDINFLLSDAVPPNPGVYSLFLDFLISKKETASAARVWAAIVKLGQPAKLSDVFDYIHYLIEQHDPARARTVWQQAGPLCGLQAYQSSPGNLVVNGDFSLNILNGGFDWTYENRPDASLELDPTQSHTGPASLLISYSSSGLDDSGIHQLIPVEPNSTYHFSGYFKTQDLEGAGGPRFCLRDFYTQKSYFESDDLKDSDAWREVTGDFQTGPETGLLALQIRRVPSGNAIRGKLWIDGVRLSSGHRQNGQ